MVARPRNATAARSHGTAGAHSPQTRSEIIPAVRRHCAAKPMTFKTIIVACSIWKCAKRVFRSGVAWSRALAHNFRSAWPVPAYGGRGQAWNDSCPSARRSWVKSLIRCGKKRIICPQTAMHRGKSTAYIERTHFDHAVVQRTIGTTHVRLLKGWGDVPRLGCLGRRPLQLGPATQNVAAGHSGCPRLPLATAITRNGRRTD